MSTFPQIPRDIVVELYVNSTWVDVSTMIYQRDSIVISRGKKDEASQYQPCTATLTFNNRSGNFSLRWPAGIYYGSIGRNTPIRISVRLVKDTFTRTVSSGWGSTDTAQAYTSGGTGGTVSASDHNVGSGLGTQSVPAVTAFRYDYLGATAYRDVDVQVDVSLALSSITGAAVEPANLLLRGQSTSSYYMVRVSVAAGGAVTVGIMLADATVLAAAVSTGITYAASTLYRVRGQCEGNTIKAKVWLASGNEPFGWHVTVHDTTITGAGWIGVRSGVATSNSNTKPIVFSYDNFQAKIPRYAGEVSSWPQKWDTSGQDIYVQVGTAGIMQRLSLGNAPTQSVLRRAFLRDSTTPIVYWPCEDSINASLMASGIGGDPLRVLVGTSVFASSTLAIASGPLVEFGTGVWGAIIPTYTFTGQRCQLRFVLSVASGGPGAFLRTLSVLAFTGTINRLQIFTDGTSTTGGLSLTAYAADGSTIYTTGAVECGLDGVPIQVSLEWATSGSNVIVSCNVLKQGSTTTTSITGGDHTITSQTIGVATYIVLNEDLTQAASTAMGHIAFYNTFEALTTVSVYTQFNAWQGETAGARLLRLCGEESVPFLYVGNLSDTAAMGYQTSQPLIALVTECVSADLGMVYEARGEGGICYTTRTALYNQAASVDLNYSNHVIANPFEPIDDDLLTKNDITVPRTGGSSVRAQLLTGRLSVNNPGAGGVGRYSQSVTAVNVLSDGQLADIANWLLHLGTVDETRYPSVPVNLANPDTVSAGLDSPMLSLDVGNRGTISNPKSGQTPDQISQLVLGYIETLNAFIDTIAINCAPESPYEINILDDGISRLDSTDSTLSAGVTSSATSISVATTSGTLWTTASGDFPFDIGVSGERMTVTNITGTSSPQTFTVTRSVNSVSKAQVTGAVVTLWRPGVLAL